MLAIGAGSIASVVVTILLPAALAQGEEHDGDSPVWVFAGKLNTRPAVLRTWIGHRISHWRKT